MKKILATYKEVKDAVYAYFEEKHPDYLETGKTYYKEALKYLGFRRAGYDMYGSNVYSNGKVRVAVYYDRGENFWCMEEAQGSSATTDNFYNTESEMRNEFGVYGCGSMYDPWNM